MAETQESTQQVEDVAQEPHGDAQTEPQGSGGTDWKAEARKWEERAKQNKARISELEGKAAKYDELEEAQKSDIERANEAATKAASEAADWKSKYEELNAEREREIAARKAAGEYGVDVDVLLRMGGDVEDNAKFLQAKEAARPKFGDMRDAGDQKPVTESLEEALAKAKTQKERVHIRAEFNAKNRNKQ